MESPEPGQPDCCKKPARAVTHCRFVPYPMRRSTRPMRHGTFRLSATLRHGPAYGLWLVYAIRWCWLWLSYSVSLHCTKQKKVSDEKTRFFINTAHDIRTPLTLIKAPLEEAIENRMVNEQALPHMNTALKNVNALLQLTTNLINFERVDVYLHPLYI